MDAILSGILEALKVLFSALGGVFDLLFFWLPSDFLLPKINGLQTVVNANAQAIAWLNWFVDIPFFVTVFGLAVAAITLWAGFQIFNFLLKKAIDAIQVVEAFGPGF